MPCNVVLRGYFSPAIFSSVPMANKRPRADLSLCSYRTSCTTQPSASKGISARDRSSSFATVSICWHRWSAFNHWRAVVSPCLVTPLSSCACNSAMRCSRAARSVLNWRVTFLRRTRSIFSAHAYSSNRCTLSGFSKRGRMLEEVCPTVTVAASATLHSHTSCEHSHDVRRHREASYLSTAKKSSEGISLVSSR